MTAAGHPTRRKASDSIYMKPCRQCGEKDRYPRGDCRPCTIRTGRKRRGIKDANGEIGDGKSCDICKVTLTCGRGPTSAAQDHSHITGNRRGWLCFDCNRGLGSFKDSPALLLAAVSYLESFAA